MHPAVEQMFLQTAARFNDGSASAAVSEKNIMNLLTASFQAQAMFALNQRPASNLAGELGPLFATLGHAMTGAK